MIAEKVPIYEIESYADYIETIGSLSQNYKNSFGPYYEGDELLFRGHSKDSYKIIPSIARPINPRLGSETYLDHEGELIQECASKLPDIVNLNSQPIVILSILQHFELPTRLLDVTESASVALFFACSMETNYEDDEDGEVICIKGGFGHKPQHYIINAIADTYNLLGGSELDENDFFTKIQMQDYYKKDDSPMNPLEDSDFLGKIIRERLYSVNRVAVAPYIIQRQRAQHGRYVIFPNRLEDGKIISRIDEINKNDTNILYARIRIRKELKRQMLRSLRTQGICQETLFPDSADKVVEGIKKKYIEIYSEKQEKKEASTWRK